MNLKEVKKIIKIRTNTMVEKISAAFNKMRESFAKTGIPQKFKRKKKQEFSESNKRPMKTYRKVLISALCFFFIVVLALSTFIGIMMSRISFITLDDIYEERGEYVDIFETPHEADGQGNPDFVEVESLEAVEIVEAPITKNDKQIQNILLIGDDADIRKNEVGRSDSMMIISVDRRNKQIKITSILRDSYVRIPGKGDNRINASYNYGGIKLAKDTVEHNFKIKIDNYIKVGFESFELVIDKMNGIQVDLTKQQAKYMDTWGRQEYGEAGIYTIFGYDAMQYMRMRRMDDDFKRTSRQRDVVEQMMSKISDYNVIDLTKLLYDVLPIVQTDMSQVELLGMIANIADLATYQVRQFSIPANNTWEGKKVNGNDVLVLNMSENARQLSDFIYTPDFDPGKPKKNR